MTRFAQPGRHWYAIYASIAIVAVLGLGSVFTETIACGTNATYHYDTNGNQNKCPNPVEFPRKATAYSIFARLTRPL